jgi:hypothetical protein
MPNRVPYYNIDVVGNQNVVSVTPTLTVHANYASGDYVGTSASPMEFTNAAKEAGGTGVIYAATLVDLALQSISTELWLFSGTITPPNDSAAWSISDGDIAKCIGVIPFQTYYASALNSISKADNPVIAYKCAAGSTSIFGCLVTRGAPTYASGDVIVRLAMFQD